MTGPKIYTSGYYLKSKKYSSGVNLVAAPKNVNFNPFLLILSRIAFMHDALNNRLYESLKLIVLGGIAIFSTTNC